jgi:pSer/pThr/pTyr-binding forkhead associated (FHA) protein
MVTADGKTRELPAMRLPILIGRAPECKLRIPVAAVSRQHCELLEEDDELIVRDMKSSNGTYVNKERVKSRELIPGDLLSVGPAVLVVRIDGHPKAIDPIISWANGAVGPGDAESPKAGPDGVPHWTSATGGAKTAPMGKPAKPAAKPGAKDDEDLSKIIADLSESDFDIDFGEEEEPKKK